MASHYRQTNTSTLTPQAEPRGCDSNQRHSNDFWKVEKTKNNITEEEEEETRQEDWYMYQIWKIFYYLFFETNLIEINERKDFNLCW